MSYFSVQSSTHVMNAIFQSSRLMLGACLVLGGVSGCNDTSLSDIAAIVEHIGSQDDANTNDNACYRQQQPFRHSVCEVSQTALTAKNGGLSLRLFWKAGDSTAKEVKPLYKFANLISTLPKNSELKFAANAGMYNSEFAPIGYTVIEGEEILSLNLNEGGGNFHLLPNGVLWWDKAGTVAISESQALNTMLKDGAAIPYFATQSGPMLVIDGQIHPKFNAGSNSKKFRNGVGVCTDGKTNERYIRFVNSDEPVNFYDFASLFKDDLNCDNALFLDGGIASALYAPEINQTDDKNMGVMVGVIEERLPK